MLAASYGVSAVAAQASPAPAVAGAVSSDGTGVFNRIGISDQVLSLACYLYMYVCVCVYIYIYVAYISQASSCECVTSHELILTYIHGKSAF